MNDSLQFELLNYRHIICADRPRRQEMKTSVRVSKRHYLKRRGTITRLEEHHADPHHRRFPNGMKIATAPSSKLIAQRVETIPWQRIPE